MEAVRLMVDRKMGAVVVADRGKLLGILSEHDVVTRVVLKRLDPAATRVAEVMRTTVPTVREDADRSAILRVMSEHHIQNLPVLDAQGQVVTVVTLRHLLRAEVSDLKETVWELVAEKLPDGPGG
jgi:CBS domain-containing protein